MTQKPKSKQSSTRLVICDSNVIIMMSIFKPSVMFKCKYTFGELAVHKSAITEIERWLRPDSKKLKKFGKPLIEDALRYCSSLETDFQEPALAEREKYHRIMSGLENGLLAAEKGMPTSTVDKDLLLYAKKHNASLATQEQTLRSLGRKVIAHDRILSFEDLVVDAIRQKLLTESEVRSDIDTLTRMGESLRTDGQHKIEAALNPRNVVKKT
ncbi:MAG: hypothetical protein NT027_04300 [Proteobacteria bacterium]|nr:hypothetical protein [Pseudomonadota bacterium]